MYQHMFANADILSKFHGHHMHVFHIDAFIIKRDSTCCIPS